MNDDDTEITTRTDYDTETDTPEIDAKRITEEAARIREDHPLSPLETPPAPAPTDEPEGGEGEQPAPGEADDKTVDYREDTSAAAGA